MGKIGPNFPSVSYLFSKLIMKSKDGRSLFSGVISDKEYKEWLASDLGKKHPPPADKKEQWMGIQQRLGDFDALNKYVNDIVGQYTMEEFQALADKDALLCSVCLTPEECLDNEQVKLNQSVSEYRHPQYGPFQLANHPMKYSGMTQKPFSPAPLPNEHRDAILKE